MRAVALVLMRDGGGTHRQFSLPKADPGSMVVLGRREDCDLRIPLGDVSRRHCSILFTDDGGLRLQDLGSSNGTYVNGRRVQESPILAGDFIQVGSLKFLVQINGEPHKPGVIPARQNIAPHDTHHPAAPLNPTAQSDAGDNVGLDPSDAAATMDGLMDDLPD